MRPRLLPPHRLGLSLLALLVGGALTGGPGGPAAMAQAETPGAKGAQIYCYMRASGNSHAVSWAAAYALIKRQSASLFKTSPTHAAVMITEAVVQNPNTFPNCGRYLGDLYSTRIPATSDSAAPVEPATASAPISGQAGQGGRTRSDRYGN
ncbi:MAG: penicillin amidase [Cyanobacteria bacterium K_Offshore_surface_m2_239]|nr:penicillin amidase [Cyanobacteria bacterium K_Offshore_surface_m2_239]